MDDFYWLHYYCKDLLYHSFNDTALGVPELPSGSWFSFFKGLFSNPDSDQSYRLQRGSQLESYLLSLVNIPTLRTDRGVKDWLSKADAKDVMAFYST